MAGGLRKEVQGFAERWIYGRGTPHIRAAFQWHRRAIAGPSCKVSTTVELCTSAEVAARNPVSCVLNVLAQHDACMCACARRRHLTTRQPQ